jgi:predicted Fe-Mo cluster-binding NifX family protein
LGKDKKYNRKLIKGNLMKIAFTSKGTDLNSQVDPRFGRCEYIVVYDDEQDTVEVIDNKDSSAEAHGAGPKTAQKIFNAKIDVVITGNGPGGNAATVLEKTGIKVFVGAGDKTIKDALEAYKDNKLEQF